MIQRIQTIFLLIAAGLLFSLFFSKFAYTPDEVMTYLDYRPFLVFTVITFLAAFVTIFCFKNRMLQIRLCIYNTIILMAYQIWAVYLVVRMWGEYAFSVTAAFPLLSGIFTLLALKYINKDEALVRASSSLRSLSSTKRKRRR